MGRPIRKTLSSATTTPPIPLDIHLGSFVVTLNAVMTPGAILTYNVEYTTDPVLVEGVLDPSTLSWFSVSGLDAKTTSAASNLMSPVTAVRLRVTTYSSGSVTLAVIQGGIAEK